MGHVRLGALPRTRKWREVVAIIEGGAGTSQIANAALCAAENGLTAASQDKGLVETIWILTQLPLAARTDDFAGALRKAGLDVSDSPGLMEIVGAMSDAVDTRLANNGGRTDLGEMAQMTAAGTIADIICTKTESLFGTTPDDVQRAFSELATSKQFSEFSRDFFSRLMHKYIDYFLSRTLPDQVGEGKRFTTLAQQSGFTNALGRHCREASRIVEEFSGGWFSKTNYVEGNISRKKAAGFAKVAMKKLVSELKEGAH